MKSVQSAGLKVQESQKLITTNLSFINWAPSTFRAKSCLFARTRLRASVCWCMLKSIKQSLSWTSVQTFLAPALPFLCFIRYVERWVSKTDWNWKWKLKRNASNPLESANPPATAPKRMQGKWTVRSGRSLASSYSETEHSCRYKRMSFLTTVDVE
jgi:hypothetical protein